MSDPSCPEPEVLSRFADGRLSASERTPLLAHLARCPDCHTVIAEAVRQGDEAQPFRRSPIRFLLPALAAAAVVALVVMSRLLVSPGHDAAQPPTTAAQAARPVAPSWAAGGPWEPGTTVRLGFSPRIGRTAFVVGRHLGALDRACHSPEAEAAFVRNQVVEALGGQVPSPWLKVLKDESACTSRDGNLAMAGPPGSDPGWVAVGRVVERWRIAASERDRLGMPDADRDLLARAGRELGLDATTKRALDHVLAQPPRPAEDSSWKAVRDAIAELIEVIEA